LKKLNVPTLVVHGLEDGLVQPSGGYATTKAIPGARLLAFPDMGHNLPQARIPEILDEIKRNTLRAS
jgi:pimeloyl-ACP methyl ester carboxylesterase